MTITRLAIGAIMLWAPPIAAAQEGPPVGTQVRIVSSEIVDWLATGRLLTVTDSHLELMTTAGQKLRVTTASLDSFEAKVGEGNAAKRGAFLGVFGGFIAGVIIDEQTTDQFPAEGNTALRIGGAVVGTVVGALIGSRFTTTRWAAVPLDVSGGFDPESGAGLEVRFRF